MVHFYCTVLAVYPIDVLISLRARRREQGFVQTEIVVEHREGSGRHTNRGQIKSGLAVHESNNWINLAEKGDFRE